MVSGFELFSLLDGFSGYNQVLVAEEEVWAKPMDEEIECIEKNQTWELVDCYHPKRVHYLIYPITWLICPFSHHISIKNP